MNIRFGTLDFYDDRGAILKKAVPSAADLPDFVKTASSVGEDDHSNQFALVMIDPDGNVHRKFATADKGNTWLSALYFGVTHDQLPAEAQKVAAANLVMACEAYDLEVPAAVLELSGDDPPTGNMVYISGDAKPPAKTVMQKAASETALPGRYPLDSAADVQTAQAYFKENERALTPKQRHEYAVKTASAAKKVGLPVAPEIEKHASEKFSPLLQGHLDVRHHHLVEHGTPREKLIEFEKLAAARHRMHPIEFAEALERIDRETGLDAHWDKSVSDPWYSTFGMALGLDWGAGGDQSAGALVKVAEDGSVTIVADRLRELADAGVIDEHFGKEVGVAFRQDPETIFNSMPLPQKKLIAQLASAQ